MTSFMSFSLSLSLSLSLFQLSLSLPVTATTTCSPLPSTSICSSILDYTSINSSSSSSSSPLSPLESSLLLPSLSLFSSLSPTCLSSFSLYLCSVAYRPCGTGGSQVCSSLCNNVIQGCRTLELDGIQALLGLEFTTNQCNGLPSTDCSAPLSPSFVPQPYYPRCELYSGSLCSSVLSPSSSIYIPAGTTQQELEASLYSSSTALLLAPQGEGGNCLGELLNYACTSIFQACDSVVVAGTTGNNSVAVTLPRLPCNSLCHTFNNECSGLFSFAPQIAAELQPQCDTAVITIGTSSTATYPVNMTVFGETASGLVLSTTCNPGSSSSSLSSSFLSSVSPPILCPSPLVHPLSPSSSLINYAECSLPCPSPLLTPSERSTAQAIFLVFILSTLLVSTFMLATWTIFPSKRKQLPTLMFSFSCFALALALCISLTALSPSQPISAITCNADTQQSHSEGDEGSGMCTFQSFSIFLWVNFCVSWWSIQAVDVHRKVVRNKSRLSPLEAKKLEWQYLAWGCAVPIIASIGAVSSGGLGSNGIEEYCFVTPDYLWVAWVFLIAPILFQGPIAVYCMVSTLVTMHMSARAAKSTSGGSASGKSFWHQFSKFKRPILFIFIYVFTFSITIAYVAIVTQNKSAYEQSTTEWVSCLFANLSNPTEVCGEHPSIRPDVTLWYFVHFCISGYGVITFLLYGTNKDNIMLWRVFLSGGGRNGDKNYKPSSKSSHEKKPSSGGGPVSSTVVKAPKRGSEMVSVVASSPISTSIPGHRKKLSKMNGSFNQMPTDAQLARHGIQMTSPRTNGGNGVQFFQTAQVITEETPSVAEEVEITINPAYLELTTTTNEKVHSEESTFVTFVGSSDQSYQSTPVTTAPSTPKHGDATAALSAASNPSNDPIPPSSIPLSVTPPLIPSRRPASPSAPPLASSSSSSSISPVSTSPVSNTNTSSSSSSVHFPSVPRRLPALPSLSVVSLPASSVARTLILPQPNPPRVLSGSTSAVGGSLNSPTRARPSPTKGGSVLVNGNVEKDGATPKHFV